MDFIIPILVCAVIGGVGGAIWGEVAKSNISKKVVTNNNLNITKEIGSLKIDTANKKWFVSSYVGTPTVYRYSDVLDVELVEDGISYKSKGGVLRAAAGSLVFGVPGAIIGASTAKTKKEITNLSVNVYLKSVSNPVVTIPFITTKTDTSGFVYSTQSTAAYNAVAAITAMINEAETGTDDVILSQGEWLCPKCGAVNQNYVGSCGCGEHKPLPKTACAETPKFWDCPKCGKKNKVSIWVCSCGEQKPQ